MPKSSDKPLVRIAGPILPPLNTLQRVLVVHEVQRASFQLYLDTAADATSAPGGVDFKEGKENQPH